MITPQPANVLHGLGLIAVLAALVAVTFWLGPTGAFALWLWYMALLLAFLSIVGHRITNRWVGFLIDDRNMMSLSRFQIALWTLVILPAIAAAAIANVFAGAAHPLDLHVPQQIWVALGIATTSLVASPLLLAPKAQVAPSAAQAARIAAVAGFSSHGLLATHTNVSDASWRDLFQGEEVENFDRVDMARVQMFFFTLILVAVYGAAIARVFSGVQTVAGFPDFDSSMTALLGISNAGYLVNKAVPHA